MFKEAGALRQGGVGSGEGWDEAEKTKKLTCGTSKYSTQDNQDGDIVSGCCLLLEQKHDLCAVLPTAVI